MHPGKAKYDKIIASPVTAPEFKSFASGLPANQRVPLAAAIGQINALRNDPEVIDYQRQLAEKLAMDEWKRTEAMKDRGVDQEFQMDEREAARQKKKIERYAGAEILNNPQSQALRDLDRGIPAKDWRAAVTDEENALDAKDKEALKNYRQDDPVNSNWIDPEDKSVENRFKRVDLLSKTGAKLEGKQWTDIKNKWASEFPDAMREIEQSAVAARNSGQPLSEAEILKKINEKMSQQWSETPPDYASTVVGRVSPDNKGKDSGAKFGKIYPDDFANSDSRYFNPDPNKREAVEGAQVRNFFGLENAKDINGKPLKNKDIALAIYNEMKATPKTKEPLKIVKSLKEADVLDSGVEFQDPFGTRYRSNGPGNPPTTLK
jgi:hypothetical protein